jgi:hypothetical protein
VSTAHRSREGPPAGGATDGRGAGLSHERTRRGSVGHGRTQTLHGFQISHGRFYERAVGCQDTPLPITRRPNKRPAQMTSAARVRLRSTTCSERLVPSHQPSIRAPLQRRSCPARTGRATQSHCEARHGSRLSVRPSQPALRGGATLAPDRHPLVTQAPRRGRACRQGVLAERQASGPAADPVPPTRGMRGGFD